MKTTTKEKRRTRRRKRRTRRRKRKRSDRSTVQPLLDDCDPIQM